MSWRTGHGKIVISGYSASSRSWLGLPKWKGIAKRLGLFWELIFGFTSTSSVIAAVCWLTNRVNKMARESERV